MIGAQVGAELENDYPQVLLSLHFSLLFNIISLTLFCIWDWILMNFLYLQHLMRVIVYIVMHIIILC